MKTALPRGHGAASLDALRSADAEAPAAPRTRGDFGRFGDMLARARDDDDARQRGRVGASAPANEPARARDERRRIDDAARPDTRVHDDGAPPRGATPMRPAATQPRDDDDGPHAHAARAPRDDQARAPHGRAAPRVHDDVDDDETAHGREPTDAAQMELRAPRERESTATCERREPDAPPAPTDATPIAATMLDPIAASMTLSLSIAPTDTDDASTASEPTATDPDGEAATLTAGAPPATTGAPADAAASSDVTDAAPRSDAAAVATTGATIELPNDAAPREAVTETTAPTDDGALAPEFATAPPTGDAMPLQPHAEPMAPRGATTEAATPPADDAAPVMLDRAEDLAEAIDRLRPLPKGGATITVQTPSLGRVALHVALEDGALRVRVVADDPAALEWFRGEHDGLLAAARQAVPGASQVELELQARGDAPADPHAQYGTSDRGGARDDRRTPSIEPSTGDDGLRRPSPRALAHEPTVTRSGGALVNVVA